MAISRNELFEAAELQTESMQIQQALGVIQLGATITTVTLTVPGPDNPSTMDNLPGPVTVSTVGMAYPPQMLAAIHGLLQSRYDAIVKRLGELGVAAQQPEPAAETKKK